MYVLPQYMSKNITGTIVAQLATGVGVLHAITVGKTSTSPIIAVDGIGAGGTTQTLITLKASIAEGTYLFDTTFTSGLRINQQSDSDINVSFVKL